MHMQKNTFMHVIWDDNLVQSSTSRQTVSQTIQNSVLTSLDVFIFVFILPRLREEPLAAPGNGEVLIQLIAAPINPADINMVSLSTCTTSMT